MKRSDAPRKLCFAAAVLALICALPREAPAGALCALGTTGFGCAGPGVANLSGLGNVAVANAGLSYLLADGLFLSFDVGESITGNLGVGATTSAWIKVTNLVAANVGAAPVNDNIYIFSDVFNPAIAGTAGVGATGVYGAAPPIGAVPVGGFYSASSQAQMNYLLVPLLAPGAAPGFSLTTVPAFAIGAPAAPFTFWEAARSPIGAGTVQLVGGLNFQLTPGSEIYMPGSLIVDANDPSAFASEAPEPASYALLGGGLILLGCARRRFRFR